MIDPRDLQAKSDQLNAVDFVKPITFRVERVDYNPRKEQPIKLHLNGCEGRPFKPCKSVLRGLVQAWSDDEQSWVGGMMTLYCDPDVKWAGEASGGIRISAISRITEPFKFTVQLNRKQRKIETWNVIPDDTTATEEFIKTHHEDNIKNAETNEAITLIVKNVRAKFGEAAMDELKDAVIEARGKLAQNEQSNNEAES